MAQRFTRVGRRQQLWQNGEVGLALAASIEEFLGRQ